MKALIAAGLITLALAQQGSPTQEASFHFDLKRSAEGELDVTHTNDQIKALSADPATVLSNIHGLPTSRMIGLEHLPKGFYNLEADGPTRRFKPFLLRSLEGAWGVNLNLEDREVEVLILSAPNGEAKLERGTPDTDTEIYSGDFGKHATSMADFAGLIEHVAGMPVFDETGLQYAYKVRLSAVDRSPEGLAATVDHDYGLKLTKAKRTLRVLVIEPAK